MGDPGAAHGGRAELPHPRAVRLAAPDEDDPRHEVLLDALARTPQAGGVAWARVRPARASAHAAWQDVLVVTAADEATEVAETAETAAVQALVSALPPDAFAKAIIVGRQVDLDHPFIEAAVTAARQLQR